MTFDERVQALRSLGFSEPQTRFLVTVALHGGFCLRRHYMTFAGRKYGAGVRDFLDRLVTRKLARRFAFRPDRGHVYHLYASSLYEAIGQDDNRNRRRTSAALIARKLMLLDYVLSHSDVEWYGTEEDKVTLFTQRFGVRDVDLPQRIYVARDRRTAPTIRYFVHKLPVGLVGEASVPSFPFLVTDVSGQGFEQFLKDHIWLLNALPHWRLVAVAPRHIPGLPACEQTFRRFAVRAMRESPPSDTDALQAYFTMLKRVERDDLREVTVAAIQAFRQERQRFAAPEYEVLYRRWKADGPAALVDRGTPAFLQAIADRRGELVTYQLPLRYDRFGTRSGVV